MSNREKDLKSNGIFINIIHNNKKLIIFFIFLQKKTN